MNSTQYSISADSRRWWWPSATLGAAALAASVAIPVVAGHASPVDRLPASPGADLPDRLVIHDDDDAGRRGEWPGDCPPPPDVRYVGVPWVPYEPTGCASIDRWWTVVDR